MKPVVSREDLERIHKIPDPKKQRKALERLLAGKKETDWAVWLLVGAILCALGASLLCAKNAIADTPRRRVNALSEAAIIWQPMRTRDLETISQIAEAALVECGKMQTPFLGNRCGAFFLALTFRESSWYPHAVGSMQERGLGQLRPMVWRSRGLTAQEVHEIDTNLALVSHWLQLAHTRCRRHVNRRDFPERVITAYGSGDCKPSRSAKLVLRWTDRIHHFERGFWDDDRS